MIIAAAYAPPGFYILAFLIIGLGAVFVFGSRALLLWRMRNAKRTDISKAKHGIFRINGTARPKDRIVSALEGRECIYSSLLATEQGSPWIYSRGAKAIFKDIQKTDFALEDGTGNADIRSQDMKKVVCDISSGVKSAISKKATSKKLLDWLKERGEVSISERIIPSDEKVNAIVQLRNGDWKLLLLCGKDYYKAESEVYRELVGFAFVAFFCFSIGIVFAILFITTA
jgi:hypothetical protein